MKWYKEIKAVGIFNWVWFVIRLRRNEFHPSLDRLKVVDGRYLIDERRARRQRAHEIDLKLSGVK